MNINKNFSRLYLSCRRGILELDIVLMNFLKKNINYMNNKDIDIFYLLLKESDNDLYKWIIKKEKPLLKFKKIVNIINKVTKDELFFE